MAKAMSLSAEFSKEAWISTRRRVCTWSPTVTPTFDRFVVRLDSAGNFVWAYATEGPGQVSFRDIDVRR